MRPSFLSSFQADDKLAIPSALQEARSASMKQQSSDPRLRPVSSYQVNTDPLPEG